MSLRKSTLAGVSAIALSAGMAFSAQADVLTVQNLGFNTLAHPLSTGGSLGQTKNFFTTVQPLNWAVNGNSANPLIYVGEQGSEGTAYGSPGNIYAVYNTMPGFTNKFPGANPPVNFFQADGNPAFEDTIFQTIPGLTANTTYSLEFLQASGQQVGFTGDTSEQWKVYLGMGGITTTCPGTGNGNCTINSAGNVEVDSQLMTNTTPSNTDWSAQNLTFPELPAGDIPATGAVLTFLAWGDMGSTHNLPPTVFLEGVNTPVPEPATLSLLGSGLLGLGGIAWRRRKKRNAAV